jgi:hypothetical protein
VVVVVVVGMMVVVVVVHVAGNWSAGKSSQSSTTASGRVIPLQQLPGASRLGSAPSTEHWEYLDLEPLQFPAGKLGTKQLDHLGMSTYPGLGGHTVVVVVVVGIAVVVVVVVGGAYSVVVVGPVVVGGAYGVVVVVGGAAVVVVVTHDAGMSAASSSHSADSELGLEPQHVSSTTLGKPAIHALYLNCMPLHDVSSTFWHGPKSGENVHLDSGGHAVVVVVVVGAIVVVVVTHVSGTSAGSGVHWFSLYRELGIVSSQHPSSGPSVTRVSVPAL